MNRDDQVHMDVEAILLALQQAGDQNLPDDLTRCAHCRGPVRGYASANGRPLCHPDFGLDCYHLATVYQHDVPCQPCADVRIVLDRR